MKSDRLGEKPRSTVRIVAAGLALLIAIGIFILSSVPGLGYPSHPDFLNTIAHFLEYLALAVCLTVALNSPRRKLWLTALIAIAIASLYGASDELHQYFIPGRNCDPVDWLVDTLGAVLGAALAVWQISGRQVKRSRERDRGI